MTRSISGLKASAGAALRSGFGQKVLLATGTNGVLAILGLLTGVITAQILGPQGRGDLAAIQLIPLILSALALLGMPEAVVYHASRNREEASALLGSALTIATLTGAAMGVLAWFALPCLLGDVSPETLRSARIFLLVILAHIWIGLPNQTLRAVDAWRPWSVIRLFSPLAWLLVLLVAVVVPRFADPHWLVRAFLAAQLLVSVPLCWAIARRYMSLRVRPARQHLRPLLAFGLPTMTAALPSFLNLRLDQLLVIRFVNTEALGYYVIAVTWSMAAMPVYNALSMVLFPHLSHRREREQQDRDLARFLPRVVLLILGLTLVMFVTTPFVIPLLFGRAFEPAVTAALILVVAAAFNQLNVVLEASMMGLGRPRAVLLAELVGLALTVGLLFLLVPRLGITGAALASVAAYAGTSMALGTMLLPRMWPYWRPPDASSG